MEKGNLEKFKQEDKEKERVYEERLELGKINIESGRFTIFPDDTADINQIEVPVGNDGVYKVIGIYKVIENSIPSEFNKGRTDGKTFNKTLLRLEFEEI